VERFRPTLRANQERSLPTLHHPRNSLTLHKQTNPPADHYPWTRSPRISRAPATLECDHQSLTPPTPCFSCPAPYHRTLPSPVVRHVRWGARWRGTTTEETASRGGYRGSSPIATILLRGWVPVTFLRNRRHAFLARRDLGIDEVEVGLLESMVA